MAARTDRQASFLERLSSDLQDLALEAKNVGLPEAPTFVDAAIAVVDALSAHDAAGTLTKENASKAIDYIIQTNDTIRRSLKTWKTAQGTKKPASTTPATTEFTKADAGVYRKSGGKMFRVYFGQQSGKMLAKEIVETGTDSDGTKTYGFEYRGKAERFVSRDEKLSLDEAKKWGKNTGTCCACARKLDVPESVAAGIGPVCAGRLS